MTQHKILLSILRLVFFLVLSIFLTSCAGILEEIKMHEARRDSGAATDQQTGLPTIIAVMPFLNETDGIGIENRLRQNIYNRFSSKNYVDLKLAKVDEKIKILERDTGKKYSELTYLEVCQAIGCDGLIFGKVTDYQKTYGGVFSNMGVTAELWMVDAKNGKTIVHIEDSVNYFEGGIPLTPLGIIMTALVTTANLREFQETRMVNELSLKLTQEIPEIKVSPALMRPVINEVITNVSESSFGRGGIVRVGLDGESGNLGTFDIGNFRRGLPLREKEPGVYLGEYAVLPGDSTQGMPIITYLKRPSGTESQWVDSSGLVSIDTIIPPNVTNLKAESFYDRIELSWDHLADLQDLSGYQVLRSTLPLSGFEVLEKSEWNIYGDRNVHPKGIYYYRVVAVDKSGNHSEFSTTVKAGLIGKGPTVITGELYQDTVLSGNYSLKGQLKVPRGVSLTIGPETTILAEKDAVIYIQGKLVVDGKEGQARLFSHKNEKWIGIVTEEAEVAMNGFLLSGSASGITLKNSEGLIENATVINNDLGISITGATPIAVWNCWVADNETGIEMTTTSSKVLKTVIINNGIGLSLKNFTGHIRNNIIIDNEKNITSDFPLKLDPNFLGSLRNNGKPQFPERNQRHSYQGWIEKALEDGLSATPSGAARY
ncbi:MAG: hypothetical protein GY799_27615 [Desulfobulbaceae bacterium]|nr:hypothetical protein [Desulfobulbaceae bacterium]